MTETIQTPEQPAAEGGASDQQVNWQARYNGQQVKLQQQAATIQTLTTQVAQLQQQVADLTAQLGTKDATRLQDLGQRDSTITTLQQQVQTLQAQLGALRGMESKLSTIKKLNRPELIAVMDAIPASDDTAALEQAFGALAGFTDQQVRAREQQLMSGITPTGGGNTSVSHSAPTTSQGWQDYLNSLQQGSAERNKAFDEWFAWLRAHPNE